MFSTSPALSFRPWRRDLRPPLTTMSSSLTSERKDPFLSPGPTSSRKSDNSKRTTSATHNSAKHFLRSKS